MKTRESWRKASLLFAGRTLVISSLFWGIIFIRAGWNLSQTPNGRATSKFLFLKLSSLFMPCSGITIMGAISNLNWITQKNQKNGKCPRDIMHLPKDQWISSQSTLKISTTDRETGLRANSKLVRASGKWYTATIQFFPTEPMEIRLS